VIFVFQEILLKEQPTPSVEIFPLWLSRVDLMCFLFINRKLAFPFLDFFFVSITHVGSLIFWLIVAVFLWLKGRTREAFILTLALVLGSLTILPMRTFLPRARPFMVLDARTFRIEGGYSFPSGHATNSFVSATVLGKKIRKIKPFLYILAVVVGYSRVYVGVHWPLDVIVGAFVGWIVGSLTLNLEKRLSESRFRIFEVKRIGTGSRT